MGQITGILRKHFKSCSKSTAHKRFADRIGKKQDRGGTVAKKTVAAPKIPEISAPTVKDIGFGHMPRHGNTFSGSEV